MAINKDEVVSELLQEVWGILTAKFPGKSFLPGYTAKGGNYYLFVTYFPLASAVLPLRKIWGHQCCQWQRTPLKAASRRWWLQWVKTLAAVFLPLKFRQRMLKRTNAQMAWEEEMSSFQFGFSSESERDGKEAIPATAGDPCRPAQAVKKGIYNRKVFLEIENI